MDDLSLYTMLEGMIQQGLIIKEWSEEQGEYVYSNTELGLKSLEAYEQEEDTK